MLYVLTAAAFAATKANPAPTLPAPDLIWAITLGFLLIVPPLYALQRAVALISTLTLGTLTAAGPFVIFCLQIIEGRVGVSGLTLTGLCLFFSGAVLATVGAARATMAR